MTSAPTPTERQPGKRTARLSKDGSWRSFPKVPHLLQYVRSGAYYARVKLRGKIIRQSLETDVFSTAKLKLLDFIKERRAQFEPKEPPLFPHALALYESELDANTRMKPSSKHYRRICIRKLQTTWPELWDKRISQIEEADCRAWAHQLHGDIAAQYFNNVVDTLRLIIDAGIKDHVRQGGKPFTNSARTVAKTRIPTKALDLPEPDQFRAVVDFVRNRSSWGPKAADLVEFLAYSGLRLYTEVWHVRWEDIDWARKELVVRGSPETATKNWAIRRIPLLPDMLELLNRMKAQREEVGQPLSGKLLEVQECPVSLQQACAKLGIAHLRHHDLRHLFATRCIESGVDIPTVARWLGHKDGGGLAMRIYGHLRNEHSQEMAKKVKF